MGSKKTKKGLGPEFFEACIGPLFKNPFDGTRTYALFEKDSVEEWLDDKNFDTDKLPVAWIEVDSYKDLLIKVLDLDDGNKDGEGPATFFETIASGVLGKNFTKIFINVLEKKYIPKKGTEEWVDYEEIFILGGGKKAAYNFLLETFIEHKFFDTIISPFSEQECKFLVRSLFISSAFSSSPPFPVTILPIQITPSTLFFLGVLGIKFDNPLPAIEWTK